MPSYRSSTAAASRAAPRAGRQRGALARPRPSARQRPVTRIRWDRVGRVALLVTFAIVIGLYLQHAITWWTTRRQAQHQLSLVHQLQRANASLTRQERALSDPSQIQKQARALGMVKPGEQAYVVLGLPKR